MRILCVEDEPDQRKSLVQFIKIQCGLGTIIDEAETLEGAKKKLKKIEPATYDVIITDGTYPSTTGGRKDPNSGHFLTEEIKEKSLRSLVVLYSGNASLYQDLKTPADHICWKGDAESLEIIKGVIECARCGYAATCATRGHADKEYTSCQEREKSKEKEISILCVDDEIGILKIVEKALRRRYPNAKIDKAETLVDAVAKGIEQYDVVITDGTYPMKQGGDKRIDSGLRLIDEIRFHNKHTAIILLTGDKDLYTKLGKEMGTNPHHILGKIEHNMIRNLTEVLDICLTCSYRKDCEESESIDCITLSERGQ